MSSYFCLLKESLERYLIYPEDRVLIDLIDFLSYLFTVNQRMNLTSITEWEDAIIKHMVDSLLITTTDAWKEATKVIDVGSGAGFPGVPLAFFNREKQVVLVEANKKRGHFLHTVKDQWHLDNLAIISERAETAGQNHDHREEYDLVLARALSSLPTLLELTIPFSRVGGVFVAYKGPEFLEELNLSRKALTVLGTEYKGHKSFTLPKAKGKRSLLFFMKSVSTSEAFPRRPGIPNKRPLI